MLFSSPCNTSGAGCQATKKDGTTNSGSLASDKLPQASCRIDCHMGVDESDCAMAVIFVVHRAKNGHKCVTTYVFLDPGSNESLCSRMAEELNLHGKNISIKMNTVHAVGDTHNGYTEDNWSSSWEH